MPSSLRLGLILVFVVFPLLEIAVLIKSGEMIGFWPTVLILMTAAAVGLIVIREQGLSMVGRMLAAMNQGRFPLEPLLDSYVLITAGFLLVMPGLISDAIGLLLLIPPVRRLGIRWALGGTVGEPPSSGGQRARKSSRPVVIEGTYERVDEDDKDNTR